jgi:hypothetical protein
MYQLTIFKMAVLTSLVFVPSATAGTLTNLSFVSNGGAFINDTSTLGSTSPLAFTVSGSTSNPFLNNSDSTISLGYGTYYAISFLGFGQHIGSGTISFLLDGITNFSQNATFPSNSPGGVIFASFSLPGGDSVEVSTTGLSADRIRIAIDGAGLLPDQTADAFYQFSYTAGAAATVPEPSSIGFALVGLGAIALGLKQKKG